MVHYVPLGKLVVKDFVGFGKKERGRRKEAPPFRFVRGIPEIVLLGDKSPLRSKPSMSAIA
jgi:hypothetical protein